MKAIILLVSYHHKNTEKIAKAMAKVLNAEIKKPSKVDPSSLKDYDLIGFGSGVYSAQHHPSIISLAEKLPRSLGKKAFLFTTTGAPRSPSTTSSLQRTTRSSGTYSNRKVTWSLASSPAGDGTQIAS